MMVPDVNLAGQALDRNFRGYCGSLDNTWPWAVGYVIQVPKSAVNKEEIDNVGKKGKGKHN